MTAQTIEPITSAPAPRWAASSYVRAHPLGCAALLILVLIAGTAGLAPWLAPHDPTELAPSLRLQAPSAAYPLGTDAYGRDLLSRILYGGRISLAIGIAAAVFSALVGMLLGLVSGFFARADAVIMRAMDGLMAIPNILLAVAFIALWGGTLGAVLVAVTLPEIPRIARLVRSVVLSVRQEPYVEAAIALGSSTTRILLRHVMPNTLGPLVVQGTYVCASAILLESLLSFLGAGVNPQIPTWGNIMGDGRIYFQSWPHLILWPGLFLTLTILAINVLGDVARDLLDPRTARQFDRS